jgi:hypothetical protein
MKSDFEGQLNEHGYVVVTNDQMARRLASMLGRVGRPELLKPKVNDDRQWSLSGMYGLGAFPWHSDGAVAATPPRWLMLRAVEIKQATYTELLKVDGLMMSEMRRTTLLVRDRSGGARYLPAIGHSGDRNAIRWDERTCKPQSSAVSRLMTEAQATNRIGWSNGYVLFVDNYRILHRRPSVSDVNGRILERTYIRSADV